MDSCCWNCYKKVSFKLCFLLFFLFLTQGFKKINLNELFCVLFYMLAILPHCWLFFSSIWFLYSTSSTQYKYIYIYKPATHSTFKVYTDIYFIICVVDFLKILFFVCFYSSIIIIITHSKHCLLIWRSPRSQSWSIICRILCIYANYSEFANCCRCCPSLVRSFFLRVS